MSRLIAPFSVTEILYQFSFCPVASDKVPDLVSPLLIATAVCHVPIACPEKGNKANKKSKNVIFVFMMIGV